MRAGALRTAWVVEPSNDRVARWTTDALRFQWMPILARHRLWVRFFQSSGLSQTRELLERARCDVVFVATGWRDSITETRRLFESISRRRDRPKLVYLDTTDPTSSPFFELLPFVDLLVKKQLLRPLSRYREDYRGGHIVADWVSRVRGYEQPDWSFGAKLPEELERRVVLGWSLGSARHLMRGLGASYLRRPMPWDDRTVDVHYRVGLADEADWYTFHRRQLRDALEPLRDRCRLVSAVGKEARIPGPRFQAEMRAARLSICPFGWGEVTDRDFHAINNLSLMIKPDMSHLVTDPDIYQPGVTYVPVRWDGSDLVQTCLECLARPEDAQRMARTARSVYRDWLLDGGFLARLGSILESVGCGSEERWSQPAAAE